MTVGRNTPQPDSRRTLAGGTPQFDVTVRVRARTADAARERVDGWARGLQAAGFSSVESVSVRPVTQLIENPDRALRWHGITKEEHRMGGVRTLTGTYDGTKEGAVLVNGLNDRAFGPVFDSYDDAEAFQEWVVKGNVLRAVESGATDLDGGPLIHDIVHRWDDPRGFSDDDLDMVVRYWAENVRGAVA